jgi:hypothetical protein
VSQALLNKIWSFLVVVLLYLCLNVWSITQQWQLSLPANPFKDGKTTPFGVALYGVLLCGPMLIVVSVVTRIYAAHSGAIKWEDRFPRFGNFKLDSSRSEARAFQRVSLFLFLIIPLLGIIHFQNKMLSGSVFRKQPCTSANSCLSQPAVISGWSEMLFHTAKDGRAGRLVYDPDLAKDIAPNFVPILEPWAFMTISLVSIGFEVWCLTGVFRPTVRKHR